MSDYDLSSVAVLTGSGISAESGIPTFRGSGGLWRNFRPEDLATPEAFERDPKLVWEWYDGRRQVVTACRPNAAHQTLVAIEQHVPSFTLITQNVDGLHQVAGSQNVVTLHGDLWTLRCTRCGMERHDLAVPLKPLPPRCDSCDGVMRPGVVWFGESLAESVLERAYRAAGTCTLMLVIGTSALVYPAAMLPHMAIHRHVPVVEFNLEDTPISEHATEVVHGPAALTLPAWWKRVMMKI